jgi:hypothetical protein
LQNNPLHILILPSILTHFAPKDLNFPELQKDPFAFALKFLTHIQKIKLWQNRLNYSGSSALIITIQPILTQRTSNGTTHWSVESPPDITTVQQDRSRFTSHEGEFTITAQLINF